MKQKDNKKDYSLTGNVNDNVNDNVNVNVNSLCSYRNSAISLQTSAIINQLTLSLTLSLTFQPWLAGSFYSIFISSRPMAIQIISRTRQIMLTNNPVAPESPNAAMESMKPLS